MRALTSSPLMPAGRHPHSQCRCRGRGSTHHRAGLFAFRTLPVFDARAIFTAFSAALIFPSRPTSGAGKFNAKVSLASARLKRSAFLASEIGWPIKPSYRKTTAREAAPGSPDNPSNTDSLNSPVLGAPGVLHHGLVRGQFCRRRKRAGKRKRSPGSPLSAFYETHYEFARNVLCENCTECAPFASGVGRPLAEVRA